MTAQPVRLAMWSGPRNISTAVMRSWENRDDCVVVDEPFYAHYLDSTGLDHPGRDEVIAAGETDWERVVSALVGPVPGGASVQYQKHMSHHLLPEIDRAWITQVTNVLLIRDPVDVVASYRQSRAEFRATDIGLLQQVDLYHDLEATGRPPPVIDAADFLGDPKAYLEVLCDLLGVPFSTAMLAWPRGPRDSDGVWAPHWYDGVLASTGFGHYRRHDGELDSIASGVAQECRPAYERLADVRLRL